MNNLKTMNVQELSVQEMKKTDGGIWNFIWGYIGGKLIDEIISNPDSFGDRGNGYYGHMGGARP